MLTDLLFRLRALARRSEVEDDLDEELRNHLEHETRKYVEAGLAPADDLESAIVATLEPGNYTAIVRGVNRGTGVGLVEAYDLAPTADSSLGNISTRGLVETGDNVMIGGIIVGPEEAPSVSILLRGIGPSLSDFGIANPLVDPMLELRDGNGALATRPSRGNFVLPQSKI